MKKLLSILFAALFVTAFAAHGQVKVTASIDSAEMLIGEQTAVRINVSHPKNIKPVFPSNLQQLMKDGVEVVGEGKTQEKEVDGVANTQYSFYITSFTPALYSIPSMGVKVGKRVYSTNQLAVKINDVKVDTTHVDKFFGPKEIIEPVYTWRDWMPLFVLSLLLVGCCVAIYIFANRLRKAKYVKPVKVVKKKVVLPHKEAEQEIEKLKKEYTNEGLSSKDYYTSLVTILRHYVNKRYGINADEMTSGELVDKLMSLSSESSQEQAQTVSDLAELREILITADLTKFAKLKTNVGEDERNITRLSEYIETTKSNQLPQQVDIPIPIVQEPSNTLRKKRLMALVGASVVTAVVVALIIFEVIELML